MVSFAHALYPMPYSVEREMEASESKEYLTHTSIHAERLHAISKVILQPVSWNLELLGRVIQPLPGENKDHVLWGVIVRIAALILWVVTLPLALAALVIGFPLRCIAHQYRPAFSYLDNTSNKSLAETLDNIITLTKEFPLHVRTHNLGLVPPFMSTTGDLRAPSERAAEIVKDLIDDPNAPDVIFFQEVFDEEATEILVNGLKERYPYIVYHVAPQISGFSSGSFVASRGVIHDVKFERFDHMTSPESMSPRGITRVRLNAEGKPVLLYGVHTQALIGEERANSRALQLDQLKAFMDEDAENMPDAVQVVMGDFNTSHVTAWGEDNLDPSGQAEEAVLEKLDSYFVDPFLDTHDGLTGKRHKGDPAFLESDNKRMGEENLPEPRGSWFHGPFADPGALLAWKMKSDREEHHRPEPKKLEEIALEESTWGTPSWHENQTAKTARFDYILVPKKQAVPVEVDVEIRRTVVPKDKQSASSDHLPVDANIWLKG